MGLVRGGWMRVHQFPVARHAEVFHSRRVRRICGRWPPRIRREQWIRLPLDSGHFRSDVFHSGWVRDVNNIL